jgi:hypothetical protein
LISGLLVVAIEESMGDSVEVVQIFMAELFCLEETQA